MKSDPKTFAEFIKTYSKITTQPREQIIIFFAIVAVVAINIKMFFQKLYYEDN